LVADRVARVGASLVPVIVTVISCVVPSALAAVKLSV
jgi:hypothetical protein